MDNQGDVWGGIYFKVNQDLHISMLVMFMQWERRWLFRMPEICIREERKALVFGVVKFDDIFSSVPEEKWKFSSIRLMIRYIVRQHII